MTRSKASLLLFALTGCLHRSPDAAVLAPIVPYLTQEPSDQSNGPEYVMFADQLTATVFESLKRNAHYRIGPMGTRLVCPGCNVYVDGVAIGARDSQGQSLAELGV